MSRGPALGVLAIFVAVGCGHTEASLRQDAIEQHDEARETKGDSAYKRARDLLALYLSEYGSSPAAGSMRLRYGDVLTVLGEHAKAGSVFDKIAASDSGLDSDQMREAAAKAVRAYEHVVPDDVVYRTDSARRYMTIDPKEQYEEQAIPRDELALAKAYGRYVEISNPDTNRIPGIKFGEGFIYFRYNQFAEAAERFAEVVKRWPDTDFARQGAKMLIDSLRHRKEWQPLAKHLRAFVKNKQLTRGSRKFIAQLNQMIENSVVQTALDMDRKAQTESNVAKRYPARLAAADKLLMLKREFPKSNQGDSLVFNAALIKWNCEQYDEAAKLYRELMVDYPKSKLFDRAQGALRKIVRQADACFEASDRPAKRSTDKYWENCVELEVELDWPEANNCWEGLKDAHPRADLDVRMGAKVRRAIALEKIGEARAAYDELEFVVKRYKESPDPDDRRLKNHVAHAAFLLAEREMTKFREMKIDRSPRSLLLKVVKAKELAHPDGSGKYATLASTFEDPCFTAAADARSTQVWHEIAQGIRASPVPPGMSQGQISKFRQELDAQAKEMDANAKKALEKALESARKLKIANRWTALTRKLAVDLQ